MILSEKIRYEKIGSDNLLGVKKNIEKNYLLKLKLKRKDSLKTKDDVNVGEAFELYLLKNFLITYKINKISSEILSYWEKIFDEKMKNKINYDIKR